MKKPVFLIGILMLGILLGGCNWLEYPLYVIFGDSKTRIKAEYPGLHEKKTAVLVMTTPAVDFEHPYAQFELASVLAQALGQNVKNAQLVDPEEIDRFQREDLDWLSLPIDEIGRKFGAQRVVYVDVIQYTTAEENSVNLLRGRIWADVSVYDMESAESTFPCYNSEIMVVYPEYAPLPMSSGAQGRIEGESIRLFAEQVSRKFYDHRITLDEASQPSTDFMR